MQGSLLLFIIYLSAFIWWVPKAGFARRAGLSEREQRMLIVFKVFTGFAGAWYLGSFANSDYLTFNQAINEQFLLLKNDPTNYFYEIRYQYEKHGTGDLFAASESFWGYIRYHLVYMITAPINFISGGDFYMNAAIFSSITYFGHLFFFRIYNSIYHKAKWPALIACFFIPSILLFTSCVHKDGLVFVSLAVLSFIFYTLLPGVKTLSFKYIICLLLSASIIFLLRNYVLVALLPAMLVALITNKFPKHKLLLAAGLYVLLAALFFVSSNFNNSFNLPEAVVKRKLDFALLEPANSNLAMDTLLPNVQSFIKNTPNALNHSLLRPYPLENKSLGSLFAAMELYAILFLLAIAIWKKRNQLNNIHSFNVYGFAFFISMLFIIGFTIPNAGAIVRYRSLLLIFLLTPALYHVARKQTKHES